MDVFIKEIEYKPGDTKWIALFSDLHYFAADQEEALLKRDLEAAARVGARMNFAGDLVDLILPGDVKRYHPGVMGLLKEEFEEEKDGAKPQRNDLMNAQVEYLFEKLRPYNELIDVVAAGNHETSAIKYHSFDVLRAVAHLLNRERPKGLEPVHVGDYRGFIRYLLVKEGSQGKKSRGTHTFDIFRHHGKGGGAYVTKGMIDLQRMRSGFIADLYWGGHKHKGAHDPGMKKIYLGPKGRLVREKQEAVQTPGYKGRLRDSGGKRVEYSYEDQFYDTPNQGYALVEIKNIISNGATLDWRVHMEVNNF